LAFLVTSVAFLGSVAAQVPVRVIVVSVTAMPMNNTVFPHADTIFLIIGFSPLLFFIWLPLPGSTG
jgi:hypothetical protein